MERPNPYCSLDVRIRNKSIMPPVAFLMQDYTDIFLLLGNGGQFCSELVSPLVSVSVDGIWYNIRKLNKGGYHVKAKESLGHCGTLWQVKVAYCVVSLAAPAVAGSAPGTGAGVGGMGQTHGNSGELLYMGSVT